MLSKERTSVVIRAVLLVAVLVAVVVPAIALGQQASAPVLNYNAQVQIPGSSEQARAIQGNKVVNANLLGNYVVAIYRFGIWLSIFLTIFMMMVGGFLWVIAGGNPSRVENAKSYITSALTGLVVAMTSFVILQTVNPALVVFQPIQPKRPTGLADAGCCCFTGFADQGVIGACAPENCENMVCGQLAGAGTYGASVFNAQHSFSCTSPFLLSQATHMKWNKPMSQMHYYGSCQGANSTPQSVISLGPYNQSCCGITNDKTDVFGASDLVASFYGRQKCFRIPTGNEQESCESYFYSWYDPRSISQYGLRWNTYIGTCVEAQRMQPSVWPCDAGIVTGVQ
ncbi:MAG: Uncharacterized protein G01um101431_1008 [Parcubacteria group bacterium Gr01-1014_31]|nr:MAG: Uncharacterized protein G01um101431_1008 [Parcubacteria group bacterium Gr01-1014_31]